MARIPITPRISIDDAALDERFVTASGPGGQNVNKVSSAVQLRFDTTTADFPEDMRRRLKTLAGQRMTKDGVLVISAQRFRDQTRNREDALERLVDLLQRAAERPEFRRPTRPTLASKRRRLDGKTARADIKRGRSKPALD